MAVSTHPLVNLARISLIVFLLGTSTLLNAQIKDTVYVEMAAINQPFMYNRLGAAQPTGMIFALVSDLDRSITYPVSEDILGKVRLKSNKRPRPIVLRANKGNILKIKFTNLLAPYDSLGVVDAYGTKLPDTITQSQASNIFPRTRAAGVHILGTEMANSISSDASWSGANPSSLANPGETLEYILRVPQEGAFLLFSSGATVANGGQPGGQLTNGLFGTLNVQPEGAEWYRSQVTEDDLDQAITHYEQISGYAGTANIKVKKEDVKDIYAMDKTYPIIDYDKMDATGQPILKMYTEEKHSNGSVTRTLVHTDLTAIITGPNRGDFTGDSPSFFKVPASPDRRRPYREFGIHYHESPWTVQAFPVFYESDKNSDSLDLVNTLATGKDNFSINYGSGGIGAEIYANRIGVGPMADCDDCAYEEFFLSSWAVGDPSMVVDIPANSASLTTPNVTQQNQFLFNSNASAADTSKTPLLGLKATKALYPDDPSNVYHSYMNDHVKFRITHAGAGLTHVHHQHAHQWLHSPDSDNGHYLDSQTINPGSSYTLEMVYNGSGNLNKTVGDQIFHCHFYPHFAAGMWSLWRVHDVLELGTELDTNGRPKTNSRALPDGEIATGTPIPGLVPIPKRAMAPVPSKTHIADGEVIIDDISRNPGFPFFIPGVSGSRPPHPPMDFAQGAIYNAVGDSIAFGALNGGLPRNVIYEAKVPFENHTQYDWTKIVDSIQVIELPEEGTTVEKVAMATHAIRKHKTLTPEGSPGDFILNGLPPVSGAPYADPAVDLSGNKVGTKRVYKAANIQLDVVLNKKGWHYPQQRIISLWGDVAANIDGIKPPEPFYFRANSREYVEYWHTNLVPEYYELDDYQVRTPTDVIGQHIHLVKFDVTASDGAANGWNYEDGTLAPDLVRERIKSINDGGKRYTYAYQNGKPITDVASYNVNTNILKPHAPNPIWGTAPEDQNWTGAQTTIQRWYADPLLNNRGEDRTLRTVFTHDHFGPSTHQQIGLYAGLLVEPYKSKWIDPVTGDQLGIANNGATRPVTVNGVSRTVSDGGPTGWQANIVTENIEDSYREFMLEFQDTQQAYLSDSRTTPDPYPEFPKKFVGEERKQFLDSVYNYRGWMDTDKAILNQGYPELISFGFRGTYSMNYRNEPLPLRASIPPSNPNSTYTQAAYPAGNLANVYSSQINRADSVFNTQPIGGTLIPGSSRFRFPVDPIGPEMQAKDPYTPLFRAYENDKIQIRTLVGAHVTSHFFNVHGVNWLFEPSNKNSGLRSTQNMSLSEHFEMNFQFPVTGNTESTTSDYLYQASSDVSGRTAGLWGIMRTHNTEQPNLVPLPNNDIKKNPVTAMSKNCGCPTSAPQKEYRVTAVSIDQLGGALVYNQKFGNIEDDAMVFIKDEELKNGTWKHEPLVLRANAGDCVTVHLTNSISEDFTGNPGTYSYRYKDSTGTLEGNQVVDLKPSTSVGLNAGLLSYDVGINDGTNIGLNSPQTIDRGEKRTYQWYAGKWENNTPIPVEFGSVVLSAPDPLEQYVKGLFGALIIEPEGATWEEDVTSSHSANIYDSNNKLLFREFVMQFQDNIVAKSDTIFSQVSYALNYKSEPLASRLTQQGLTTTFNQNDLADITSNVINNGDYPETPHFVAKAGDPLRIRILHPGGNGNTESFNLHGHVWQEEPYTDNSTQIGYNDKSQWFGFRDQIGPLNSFDLVINSAGGDNKVPGDYIYNSMLSLSFQGGIWGIMTVTDATDYLYVDHIKSSNNTTTLFGLASVDPSTGKLPKNVTLEYYDKKITAQVSQSDGSWEIKNIDTQKLDLPFIIKSSLGGKIHGDSKYIAKLTKKSEKNPLKKVLTAPTSLRKTVLLKGVHPNRVEGKKVKID